MPYVRRREFQKLSRNYEQALVALASRPTLAAEARLTVVHQQPARRRELCLFVTYAPRPEIKAHVLHHLRAFQDAGFDTALIINTDHAPERFAIDPTLQQRCRAICIRQNVGYDFAAWSHLAQLLQADTDVDRIVLANDSIIGPLEPKAFEAILRRVRASSADVVGLTESRHPRWHLQSFFLVFQHAALRDGSFSQMVATIQNLPSKELVIELYETRVSQQLHDRGLKCEALFPCLSTDIYSSNDTHFRWDTLIETGFPYLKISVLSEGIKSARIRDAIPDAMLAAWEREQG